MMGHENLFLKMKNNNHLKPIFIAIGFITISIIWFYFSDDLLLLHSHRYGVFFGYDVDSDIIYALVAGAILYVFIKRNNQTLNKIIQRLVLNEEQLRIIVTAIQHANDAIVIADLDGIVKWTNRRYYEYTGYTEKETLNQPIPHLVNDKQNDEFYGNIVQQVKSGKAWQGEVDNEKKNGEIYRESLSFAPVYNHQGHVIRYISIFRDITEEYQNKLELERSLKEKEVLLAEIHHRVKNNLAMISGLIDLQIFQTDDKEIKLILSDLQMRLKSIALVHENLYQEYLFSEIRLDHYLEDLLKSVQNLYQNKDQNIILEVDAIPLKLDMVQAVPFGLLATELITNAYKHAFPDNRDGKIIFKLRNYSDEEYQLIIKDNGIGIDDSKKVEEANSLGFKLIQTLVKQLKGDLELVLDYGFGVSIFFKKKELDYESVSA